MTWKIKEPSELTCENDTFKVEFDSEGFRITNKVSLTTLVTGGYLREFIEDLEDLENELEESGAVYDY